MKKNAIHIFFCIFILINILLLFKYIIFPINHSSSVSNNTSNQVHAALMMNPNKEYHQSFECRYSHINQLSIKFSNYGSNNEKGELQILVKNSDKKILFSKKYDVSKIYDNEFIHLNINSDCKKGDLLELSLIYKTDNKASKFTYWYADKDIGHNLLIDNEKVNQELIINQFGKVPVYNTIWFFLILISIALIPYGLYVFGGKNEKK